ncbi:unnamed protein product [Auanema sp. JU1783]|nr:unnamed protein product [Auanema sp. JU1783]
MVICSLSSEGAVMLYSLPIEVLTLVFKQLDSATDKLNFALSCKKFLAATIKSYLPSPRVLRLSIGDCPSLASVTRGETFLSVCQCAVHGSADVLQYILPFMSRVLESIELEEELTGGGISDNHMSLLLACCSQAPLTRLIMSRCDLRNVRPWTLSMLAHYDKLHEVAFEECTIPISETLFIRSIASSFHCLTFFEITSNRIVTDRLARVLARNCPLLEKYSVAGCPAVSTFTALTLIETAFNRRNRMLQLHLQNTKFDSNLLARYMRSPLFPARNLWRLRPCQIDLGFEKYAILAEHEEARCVLIYT